MPGHRVSSLHTARRTRPASACVDNGAVGRCRSPCAGHRADCVPGGPILGGRARGGAAEEAAAAYADLTRIRCGWRADHEAIRRGMHIAVSGALSGGAPPCRIGCAAAGQLECSRRVWRQPIGAVRGAAERRRKQRRRSGSSDDPEAAAARKQRRHGSVGDPVAATWPGTCGGLPFTAR